jgi:hypothetical protein
MTVAFTPPGRSSSTENGRPNAIDARNVRK